jgi:predicted RNase H-like HicB family nuclease
VTPTLVAGGLTEDTGEEVAATPGGKMLILRYTPTRVATAGPAYRISISKRLSAVLRRSEDGWIARAPDLNALGHGDSAEAALDDLAESIGQYLEFLRDDRPELAPAIAHHGGYISLLQVPQGTWFASVDIADASTVE